MNPFDGLPPQVVAAHRDVSDWVKTMTPAEAAGSVLCLIQNQIDYAFDIDHPEVALQGVFLMEAITPLVKAASGGKTDHGSCQAFLQLINKASAATFGGAA